MLCMFLLVQIKIRHQKNKALYAYTMSAAKPLVSWEFGRRGSVFCLICTVSSKTTTWTNAAEVFCISHNSARQENVKSVLKSGSCSSVHRLVTSNIFTVVADNWLTNRHLSTARELIMMWIENTLENRSFLIPTALCQACEMLLQVFLIWNNKKDLD